MFWKHDCKQSGHRFEARYDEEPSGYTFERSRGISPESYRKLLIRQVYVHDICVRCGETKQRPTH